MATSGDRNLAIDNAGRELDVVRDFVAWDSPFPDSFHSWLAGSGRTMILSVKSKRESGDVIPFAEVAAARPGSQLHQEIVSWADRVKALGVPIYFAYNHEPESGSSHPMGDAPEFIAAWRNVHSVFADRAVTNAKFIWIMTDYAFFVCEGARNHASRWYPGDAYVDAMGADAYNWFTCRTGINTAWKSLERIIRSFRDFGLQHPDEEMWLTEWASTEDPAVPGRKAQWYADAQALFKRPDFEQFHGVSYFDNRGQGNCQWFHDSTPSSLAAFRAMGTDAFYGGTTPSDPEPRPINFVTSASRNGNYATHTLRVPDAVQPGDTMLLFFTANTNPAWTEPPSGWTEVRAVDPAGLRGRLWVRTASTIDPGSTVTVRNASITKADLAVAVYRNVATDPVDASAVSTDTSTTSRHTAPAVTPSAADSWVVAYWADKSSTNTGHTIPATEVPPGP